MSEVTEHVFLARVHIPWYPLYHKFYPGRDWWYHTTDGF